MAIHWEWDLEQLRKEDLKEKIDKKIDYYANKLTKYLLLKDLRCKD